MGSSQVPAIFRRSIAAPIATFLLATVAIGQRGEHRSYAYTAAPLARVLDPAATVLADEHVVRVPGRAWLSLELDRVVLRRGSKLEIESLADGDVQTFTRDHVQPRTAYFNGDTLRVRLWSGPGTSGNTYTITGLTASTRAFEPVSVCGKDERQLSADKRVARQVLELGSSGGTIYRTCFLVSRWHCFVGARDHILNNRSVTVQFNVPPSASNGALRHPPAKDQYLWSQASNVQSSFFVFTTRRNSQTGKYPGEVQQSWFRWTTNAPTPRLRVTGYGVDLARKTRNQVQQTAVGIHLTTVNGELRFTTDLANGNYGSPVIGSDGLVRAVARASRCRIVGYNSGLEIGAFKNAMAKLCGPPAEPDLTPVFFRGPTSITAGRTYQIQSRVSNAGGASAQSVKSGYYLSGNHIISTIDRLVSEFTTIALAPAKSHFHAANVTMPRDLASSPACWLGVYADHLGGLSELVENNNSRAGVQAKCAGLPDLTVTRVAPSATRIWPGRLLTIRATLKNSGKEVAPASRTGFYLSQNDRITTSDILLASQSTLGIAVNATRDSTAVIRVPNNLPSPCWLGAYADHTALVEEQRSDNNARAVSVVCGAAPQADLVPTALQAMPVSIRAAANATLSSTIRNDGDAAATTVSSGYYLSTDSVITAQDTLLAQFTTPALAAKQAANHRVSARIPSSVRTGQCWVGVWADHRATLTESDEGNNTRVVQVTCVGVPDLIISQLEPADVPWQAGASIAVLVATKNTGGATAPAATTAIYQSRDAEITTGDDLLTSHATPSLGAGSSHSATLQVRVPWCSWSGKVFVGAIADAATRVAELDEGNNTASAQRNGVSYAGSGRHIEWENPRLGNNNGPFSAGHARFKAAAGGSARMCITAPRAVGNTYLCLWSGNPNAFAVDGFTSLSLGLLNGPIFASWLGVVGAGGKAHPSFHLPKLPVGPPFDVYTYVAFWSSTGFLGLGDDRVATRIQ